MSKSMEMEIIMIKIKPDRSKTLTFNLGFQGMNISDAISRVLIPISENLIIQVPGELYENKVIVKIPPLNQFLGRNKVRKTRAILEVIVNDRYFKPYETEIIIEDEPEISEVTLEENEKVVEDLETKLSEGDTKIAELEAKLELA